MTYHKKNDLARVKSPMCWRFFSGLMSVMNNNAWNKHRMSRIRLNICLAGLLTLSSAFALTQPVVPMGHQAWLDMPIGANPWRQRIQVQFPEAVKTVGDAMQVLLRFSGYHLVPVPERSHAMQTLLVLPLPEFQRQLGPMTLLKAMEALSGPGYQLLLDPVHRTVAFRVKPMKQVADQS